jgi:pSer/pThr/pTyr-binding forkhead associated (FHA) protein
MKSGMNSPTAFPSARLVLRTEDGDREYLLQQTEQLLGREPSNDIVLNGDEQVSGRHLRVFVREGRHHLEDTGSTNGTYLNGERVTEAVLLNHGDLVKAGKTILKFVNSGDNDAGTRCAAEAEQSGSDSNPGTKTRMTLNLPDVRFNLGLVYFKKGEFARAIETWEKELSRRPDERLKSWIGKAKACLAEGGED